METAKASGDRTDLEGAIGQRVLEHVACEVGALAGRLQQQVGGQAEEGPLDLAAVQRVQHVQHALQRGPGETLLLAPEVTHVQPGREHTHAQRCSTDDLLPGEWRVGKGK